MNPNQPVGSHAGIQIALTMDNRLSHLKGIRSLK
jgi:hypothetical protein